MRRAPKFPTGCDARHPRRRAGPAAAVLLVLASLAAPPAAGAATGKTTHFTGRIVAGTGRYVHLRGTVALVLHTNGGSPAFTVTVSSPSCAGRHPAAPARCVALSGTLRGTAVSTRHNPDVGASFALTGSGRVAPLGPVTATGSTASLGFIARGRFPLTLRLRTKAGALSITAQGPLVNGFSSPF